MSDINRWDELVQVVKLRARDTITDEWLSIKDIPIFSEYVQVPLNEYQMGNLLGMILRAQETGDWYQELISIIGVAMAKAGIEKITSNLGDEFTLKDIRTGNLKIESNK